MVEIKPLISPEVLEQIDIRVGLIEQVEDIPASSKLVRLTVDFGDFKRTILVGRKKERENPREIEGRQADQLAEDGGEAPQQHAEMDLQQRLAIRSHG